VDLASHEFPT